MVRPMSSPGRTIRSALALAVCLGNLGGAPAGSLATIFSVATLISALPEPVRAADMFLSVAEDVPVMPGLAEDRTAALVFDKPAGRIVTAEARGAVSRNVVLAFYAQTLPQLGWTLLSETRFQREAEILQLDISPPGGTGAGSSITVRFELTPR